MSVATAQVDGRFLAERSDYPRCRFGIDELPRAICGGLDLGAVDGAVAGDDL